MRHFALSAIFLILTLIPRALGDGPAEGVAPLLALEKAIQDVVVKLEPAVAAIAVSRSDGYQRLGKGVDREFPGKLGIFDPTWLQRQGGFSQKKDLETWLRKLDLAHPDHVPQGFGSGVVLDGKQGLILTNFHVVQDATKIYVRLHGGKSSYADILAGDARCDLAVLKLLKPRILPIPEISLGDASELKRGSFLISMANLLGAGFRDGQCSVSFGVLSNLRRRGPIPPTFEDGSRPLHYHSVLLQTDSRLHLGSSGGALFNLKGELVGLSTALAAIQGGETPGGFALPINDSMQRLIAVLKRGEEIDYGLLGVAFEPRSSEREGAITIDAVTPGSPADLEAKLVRGDEIVALNGMPLRDMDDLYFRLSTHLAGAKVKLQARRPNRLEPIHAEVTLAKLNVNTKRIVTSHGSRPVFRGLRVDYSSLACQQPVGGSLLQMPAGVWVAEVQPNSAAGRANLKAGDIITHVNGRLVASPQAFYAAVDNIRDNALTFTMYNPTPMDPPHRIHLK